MSGVEIERTYTNASCNRHIHCLDWAFNQELICFAATNAIAIYHVQKFKIIDLLLGHAAQVNSVRWISHESNHESFIISTSNDKTAIIWHCLHTEDSFTFQVKYKLIGHTGHVMMADLMRLQDNRLLSATCSNEKSIRIWINENLTGHLDVDNFVFDVKIIKNELIFPNIIMIAFAGADEMVHLCTLENDYSLFMPLINLRGHEDWIKSIDITFKNDYLLIASSSQDNFIRIHKIEPTIKTEIPINEKLFSIKVDESEHNFVVKLETVLAGHEHWVNQVKWNNQEGQPLLLLSASMDKTIMLWEEPEHEDDLWNEKVRVGEIGGNCLGFLGCAISSDARSLIGYSFNGAFHLWKEIDSHWKPVVTLSGHFDQVSDICWDPKGEFLLSCSFDETTRLHAPWNVYSSWHEVARPQIHGFELNCISVIDRLSFVSGADEKVLRIFKATKCFAESIEMISDLFLLDGESLDENALAHSASVAPLGLSNQAVYELNQIDHAFKPTNYDEPPSEEMMLQNTLWPEIQKLYGHGYELFSVAVNHASSLIASACKASKAEYANIILWSIKEAKQIASLESHQLTVTQIRFSHDDRYILSVSRDRSWALFQQDKLQSSSKYSRVAFSDKKTGIHSRILWDCAFTPDDQYFVTVSRDKTAIFWQIHNNNDNNIDSKSCLGCVEPVGSALKAQDSIMSVDIANILINDCYLIAIGLENGNVCLYKWSSSKNWIHLEDINHCHHLSIKRLRFSPKKNKDIDGKRNRVMMGSCGADRMVKIHTILV